MAKPSKTVPLKEGLDYYMEHGNWVFTEHFLKKRGYCCGNGCRHCPYKAKPDAPNFSSEPVSPPK